jgi:hypothetical protein
MFARRLLSAGPVVLALAMATGCGDRRASNARPKVVSAGGVVRLEGRPLEGALVTFTNATLSASGRTDAEGRFTLTTYESGDGAAPGKHTVTVSKVQLPERDPAAVPMRRTAGMPPSPQARSLIPSRYADPATSGLSADVGDGGSTDIVIEIKGS